MRQESRRQKAEGRDATRRFLPGAYCRPSSHGFSLIELVITVAVLAILTLGVVPLVQVSVKRQKEQQLRESLREMREAIDQFHREAVAGAQMQANQQQGQTTAQQEAAPRNQPNPQNPQQGAGNIFNDPRVRVAITDQTIFTADNPDRFPPDLDTLVKGVNVLPIAATQQGLQGGVGLQGDKGIADVNGQSNAPKTKVYLRRIPVDPMTGKAEWEFRSCYDSADTNTWGGENIFDVHSKSDGVALNGEKYRDW
jgi:general secretion pathway protein G